MQQASPWCTTHVSGPQHHLGLLPGDVGRTVLLPGDPKRTDVIASFWDNPRKVADQREFVTWTGSYKGVRLSTTSTGIGCPSTAIAVEELANVGARHLIRVGTCGAFQPELAPGTLVIATGAVRGDGTSIEYIPVEYPAVADFRVVGALRAAAERLGEPYVMGIVRTHDAFYIESPLAHGDWRRRIGPWVDAGVLAVENESSTLFVVSSLRRVAAGTILVCAGNLVNKVEYAASMLADRIKAMIRVACEAAVILEQASGGD